jgi:hypothetical protein
MALYRSYDASDQQSKRPFFLESMIAHSLVSQSTIMKLPTNIDPLSFLKFLHRICEQWVDAMDCLFNMENCHGTLVVIDFLAI